MKARCSKCAHIFEISGDGEVIECPECQNKMRMRTRPGSTAGTPAASPPSTKKAAPEESDSESDSGSGAVKQALPAVMRANKVIAGRTCPVCSVAIALGTEVHNCEKCSTSHHAACWDSKGGCSACAAPKAGSKARVAAAAPDEGEDEKKPCKYCGEMIQKSARKCRFCDEFQNERDRRMNTGPAGYGGYGGRPVEIPNYLVASIITTIMCCWPIGIFSIIYAAQVNNKLAAGDVQGAQSASNTAKTLIWVNVGLTLVGGIAWVMIAAASGR